MIRIATSLLLAGAATLTACQQASKPAAEPPSPNEQAALVKAEAMIEENRDRLETEEVPVDETGNDE